MNKVILIGRAGADAEVKFFPDGGALSNVSVATSRSWKDKTTGEKVDETEWHRVVFSGRLAEIAGSFVKKGRELSVEGRLKTRKWSDKEGIERYTTEIVAERLELLGGKSGGQGDSESFDGYSAPSGYKPQARQMGQTPAGLSSAPPSSGRPAGIPRKASPAAPSPRSSSSAFDGFPKEPSVQSSFSGGFQDDDIPFNQIDYRLA